MSFRYYFFDDVRFGYINNGVGFVETLRISDYDSYVRFEGGNSPLHFAFCNGVDSGSACLDDGFFQYLNSSPRSVSLSPVSSDDYYIFSSLIADDRGFLYFPANLKKDVLFPYSDFYYSIRCNCVLYDYKNDKFYSAFFDGLDSLKYYPFSVVPYFLFSAFVDVSNYNHFNPNSPFSSLSLLSGFNFHYKIFPYDYFDIIYSRVDNSNLYFLNSSDYDLLSSLFPFVFKPIYCNDGVYFGFTKTFSFPVFSFGCSGVDNIFVDNDIYYLSSCFLRFHSFDSFLSFLGNYYLSSSCMSCCPNSSDILSNILKILGG